MIGLLELLEGAQCQVTDKVATLEKSLVANEKWKGCMGMLGASSKDMTFLEKDMRFVLDEGACDWMAVCRHFGWRHGPQSIPLPGIGCLAMAEDSPVVLQISRVEALLAEGIALPDFPAYMDTESGRKYMQDHSTVIIVRCGDVLWIPYGFTIAAVGVPADEVSKLRQNTKSADSEKTEDKKADNTEKAEEKGDKKKPDKETVATSALLCLPFFVTAWAKELQPTTWNAIHGSLHKHLTQVKTERLWETRAATMASFAATMA